MKTFSAILLYALSLFGIDLGSHTRIDRIRDNGSDVLYSRVVTQATGTQFECVRSASGQCYYTVFARQCTPAPAGPASRTGDCALRPESFALADGDSRQLPALPNLHLCVGTQARNDCQ